MDIAIVTGSAGLIGSEAVTFFSPRFDKVVGIDNNLRQYFFGETGSTAWNQDRLQKTVANYSNVNIDIRDVGALEQLFKEYGRIIVFKFFKVADPPDMIAYSVGIGIAIVHFFSGDFFAKLDGL